MPTATVHPISIVVPVTHAMARAYGLEVTRVPGFVAGVTRIENVWLEAPLEADEHWIIAYRIAIQGRRAIVSEVRVFPNEANRPGPGQWSGEWKGRFAVVPAGGLRTRALRASIRVGQHVHSLKLLVERAKSSPKTRWALQPGYPAYAPFGLTEDRPTDLPVKRSGRGRPRLPPIEYARLASAYVAAVKQGSGTPIQDLAEAFHLSASQVRARIHTARQLKFLEPGRQGYAGGELSAAARRLLQRGRHDGHETRTRRGKRTEHRGSG